MSNENLPVSPLTGKPSALRALVERSVIGKARSGPQPGETVWTGPAGSTLTYDPARAAGVPVAPGQLPGQQLSQGRGLSPRQAVRAGQQIIPARREVAPDVTPAPDQTAAAVAQSVAAALAPVVAQIGQALAAAVASVQPVTRSAQPGRSIALNTGPGSYGMPRSYNRAIVEMSLGREHSVIPAPKPRALNCVEIYQLDKMQVASRGGIW